MTRQREAAEDSFHTHFNLMLKTLNPKYYTPVGQVMEQCRDVHATRQRAAAEDPAPALPALSSGKAKGGPPGAKDWSAFRIALMAAKRKAKPPSGRI